MLMAQAIPMIGKRFGRLTVIAESGRASNGVFSYICQCDCGQTTKPISGSNLRRNIIKSCGCLRRELGVERGKATRKHGKYNTRLHSTWSNMKARCNNPNNKRYACYGARGIKVCEEWSNSFEAFYDWAMANGYEDTLTIDRIDNDKGYSPDNCRWATFLEQQRNKRDTVHIEIDGKTLTLSQLANEYGVPKSTVVCRYRRGIRGVDLIRGCANETRRSSNKGTA